MGIEAVPADSAHFLPGVSGCDHELESVEPVEGSVDWRGYEHTRVWDRASEAKEAFVVCAVLARADCNSYADTILPDQQTTYFAAVESDQQTLRADLGYPGSLVTMTLRDPNDVAVDPAYPNIVHEVGTSFERYEIPNPKPGQWTIELFGADVPPEGEPTTVIWDTVPLPLANDGDEDGVDSPPDNCPDEFNPFQEEADGDGVGDACENEDDDDGVLDADDNCPTVANPAPQPDSDGDGLGDACDDDFDNDFLADADESAHGTGEDNPDSDGDGVLDGVEVHWFTSDPLSPHSDADGCSDGQEAGSRGAAGRRMAS
jgi:hypothetical protein